MSNIIITNPTLLLLPDSLLVPVQLQEPGHGVLTEGSIEVSVQLHLPGQVQAAGGTLTGWEPTLGRAEQNSAIVIAILDLESEIKNTN